MRIAEVATVNTPVLRETLGSVEGLVWRLSDLLQKQGHEVTVFATADSEPPCELVPTLPGPVGHKGAPDKWELCEWINLCRAIEESERFDVIHTHSYLWSLPVECFSRCPMVHTMHVLPTADQVVLRQTYPHADVIAVSAFQWSSFPDLPPAAIVRHGLDPAQHTFTAESQGYLCFLGRLIPQKGVLDAITTARCLEMPLKIAGPRIPYFGAFFDSKIRPMIDGDLVQWVGPVGLAERDELLGGAAAMLYPIHQAEPFGLVLVEAMLTGTPVAAPSLGAVPEIVEEGLTGALEPAGDHLSKAVRRCMSLDRARVRARAVERFSAERMVREYEAVFGHAMDSGGVARQRRTHGTS